MALFAVLITLASLHVDSLRGGVGTVETIYNVSPNDRLVLEPYLCPVGMKYLELVHSDGDSTATVRTIKPLDAEEIMLAGDALYYSVTCLGGPKNIRSVEVIDLNDNPPIFQSKTYGITVAEAISVGSDVLSVTATDNDLSPHHKGLSYSILPPVPDAFELSSDGPMNGCKIRLTKQLNYNNAQYYNFAVKASDKDYSDTAIVTIAVKDYDSHNPYFDHCLYKASIEENKYFWGMNPAQIDGNIGTIRNLLLCQGVGQGSTETPSKLFANHNALEQLTNHDTFHFFGRRAFIKPRTNQVVCVRLVKKVGHFSDITPEAIKAQDGDTGINTPVVYSIATVIPKKYQNNFKIDLNSGVISVTTALDREETEQISVFIQAAQNNHPYRTADATVLVTVVDVNDIQLKLHQGDHSSHFS